MWLTNIIRGVSISCAADVGNMFDIVNVASWRMIGNKLPQTCLSTQPSLFPCQPRRPACLRNNRSSFTTTHRLDITLNSFKRTSEKKAQHVSLPPAPQLHKVIKDCACRMIRMSHDGETDRGKDMFVIFLLNPFFLSIVRKLNLEAEWDIIQTSLHRGKKHDSTQSRCLHYIREHITSSLPAPPILTSQPHHVRQGGNGPLLLFRPRLWVRQHLTADPSAKCEPRRFWNKSCRLCL